jgi:hypothetical protein
MGEGEFDLLAASLRADLRDFAAFIEALAVKLEGALPGQTAVKRRSQGLRSPRRRVEHITVDCGGQRYELDYAGRVPTARRATVVGGIALKSDAISVEEWLEGLARWLADEAGHSEQGRRALERLLG